MQKRILVGVAVLAIGCGGQRLMINDVIVARSDDGRTQEVGMRKTELLERITRFGAIKHRISPERCADLEELRQDVSRTEADSRRMIRAAQAQGNEIVELEGTIFKLEELKTGIEQEIGKCNRVARN